MNRKTNLLGILCLVIFLFTSYYSSAVIVTGKVIDTLKRPVAYASVYIKGTTKGTTTNENGIYSLDLAAGQYVLVFRMMGYTSYSAPISVNNDKVILNVTLHDETMQLKEVTIKAGEDPAYNMIRQAIKMRKHYKEQVNAYSCNVYIKGIQRITKHPEKLLGQDISNDMLGLIDTSNIIYLSESVSKFNFKQPDKIKEEMISSKVSGDNQAFSYNSASDMLFDFYESVMQIGGLSERGFISPIAPDAMLYYKYRLDGTYQENGNTVDKIQVIGRRKNDPVFRGYIYLEESGWRIYGTNLYLTKDAQIDFVDTLVINQTFVPVTNDIWMPVTNKFMFHFGALGFKGAGLYVGVNADYNVAPDFPKRYFGAEDLKIDTDANKKDTLYWHETRPVPLTIEEVNDYRKRDSIMAIRKSKKYLDSVDKKTNKFKPLGLFVTGYNYHDRYKKQNISFSAVLQSIQYNTVEGLRVGEKVSFSQELEHHREYSITPSAYYGFSDHRLNGGLGYYYNYKPEKFSSISVNVGRSAEQFNQVHPYSYIFNEVYTLLEKQNFMKLYQSDFINVKHSMELINGVQFTTSLKYESRSPLMNTDNFSLVKINRDFSSNDPQGLAPDGVPSFNPNKALLFDANFKINFAQHYYTRPYEKIIEGSKYPALNLYYKKGIAGVIGSNVNYDYVQASVDGKINMKMIGNSNWTVTAGKFLNNKDMYFMDYYHFQGNQTIFTNSGGFELLPYYKYSTNGQFVQANFEHHFGGLILNKFPLIRKLKLSEIAGVNYLTTNTLNQYGEFYVGVEKLHAFRVIFVSGFAEGQKTYATFRFGISSQGGVVSVR